MTAALEVRDPGGRLVVLDSEGWDHIRNEHPELGAHRGEILTTIGAPEYRRLDPRWQDREQFWRRGAGPSRWLLVVVDWDSQPARVVTAFGNRKDPPGWTSAS